MKNLRPHSVTLPFAHPELIGQPLLLFGAFSMEEIWKEIEGYPDYEVSNLGRVKKTSSNIIMKQWVNNSGYLNIRITKDKTKKRFFVHRLVLMIFIGIDKNKLIVNHKDGNKKNNNLSNLEWCTYSENLNHAYKILNRTAPFLNKKGALHNCSKVLIQKSLGGTFVKEWGSLSDAIRETKFTTIRMCLNGRIKKSGNFLWQYKKMD